MWSKILRAITTNITILTGSRFSLAILPRFKAKLRKRWKAFMDTKQKEFFRDEKHK